MSSALYAISYTPTSSVIALCRLEKQTLVDQAAWDQLRAALVGQRLPISISTSAPTVELALPAGELGCDLVNDLSPLDLEPVLAEPFRYRVVVDPAGPTVAGDGKPKLLGKADVHSVSSITLTPASDGARAKVTVTLRDKANVAGARLVFEGRAPISSEPRPPTEPLSDEVVFRLPAGVAIVEGTSYAVMFLMEDTATEARLVRPSQGPEGVRALVTPASPVTPAPSSPSVTLAPPSSSVTPALSSPSVTPGPRVGP